MWSRLPKSAQLFTTKLVRSQSNLPTPTTPLTPPIESSRYAHPGTVQPSPRPSVCELLDASTHDITAHHVFPGPYAPRPPPVRSSAHGCPQIRVQRRIQGRRRRQGVRLQGLQLRLRICLQGSAGSLQGHLGRWPRHLGRCQGRRQLPEQGRWPDRKTGRFRGEYVQTPSIPQLLALGPTVLYRSRPSSWNPHENEWRLTDKLQSKSPRWSTTPRSVLSSPRSCSATRRCLLRKS